MSPIIPNIKLYFQLRIPRKMFFENGVHAISENNMIRLIRTYLKSECSCAAVIILGVEVNRQYNLALTNLQELTCSECLCVAFHSESLIPLCVSYQGQLSVILASCPYLSRIYANSCHNGYISRSDVHAIEKHPSCLPSKRKHIYLVTVDTTISLFQ